MHDVIVKDKVIEYSVKEIKPHDYLTEIKPLLELISGRQKQSEVLSELNSNTVYFVAAIVNDNIVGFAKLSFPYWNRVGIIEHLVVNEETRHHGIGTTLIENIMAKAREQELRIIAVQTADWNTEAIKFYQTLGFNKKAQFANYLGSKVNLVWLDKAVDPQ